MDSVDIEKIIKKKKVNKKLILDCHGPLAHVIYNNLMGNKTKTTLSEEQYFIIKNYLKNQGDI